MQLKHRINLIIKGTTNQIYYKLLFAILIFPTLSYSQNDRVPNSFIQEDQKEKPDDPYLPNAYNNKKLSPAYNFNSRSRINSSSSGIITHQVNVSPGQQNIVGDAANEPNIAVNPSNP